jgi:MATE family multidrug resistance protein
MIDAPGGAAPALDPSEAPGAQRKSVVPMLATLAALALTWTAAALGAAPAAALLAASVLIPLAALAHGLRVGWVHGPTARRVGALGGPVVLAMLSQAAINVVDMLFIGRLPAEVALPGTAAIGVSLPVFWLVGGFLSAIGTGTQALTARRIGAGDDLGAGQTLTTGATLAIVLGLTFSALGYAVLPYALPFFNADPGVLEQGVPFARIRYLGISSMVITAAYKAFFDATGRTHVHMVAAIVMNVANFVLCYGLIFGELGMPRLEVAGAAWASTLSSLIGTFVVIGWTFVPSLRARYGLYGKGTLSGALLRRIVSLSLPSGATQIVVMTGFLFFHKAVGALDAARTDGLAVNASATAVIQQLVILLGIVSLAFATATATLVSQSMGAKAPERAARYGWESAKLGVLVMAIVVGGLVTYPELVLGAFMKSGQLGDGGKTLAVAAGVAPLRLISASAVFIVAALVFTQALYGAGNTKFVMLVELVLHLTCLVPLAWLFGVVWGGGLVGVWASAGLYVLLSAAIMGAKFAEGRWKTIEL